MRTLNCPRCRTPLETRPVATASGPVVVDVCTTGCGGVWLDSDDMSAGLDVTDDLQALTVAPTRTPDTSLPVNCPICDTVMVRYRWNYTSPVVLDQCEGGHGTWVDGGEVQAMEEFEEQDVLPLYYRHYSAGEYRALEQRAARHLNPSIARHARLGFALVAATAVAAAAGPGVGARMR